MEAMAQATGSGAFYLGIRDRLAAAIRIADGYRYGGQVAGLTRGRIAGDLRRIRGELDTAIALCRGQGSCVGWGAWLMSELQAIREHTLHDGQAPAGVLLERMFRMYRLSYTLSYVQLAVAWEAVQWRAPSVRGRGGAGRLRGGHGDRLGMARLAFRPTPFAAAGERESRRPWLRRRQSVAALDKPLIFLHHRRRQACLRRWLLTRSNEPNRQAPLSPRGSRRRAGAQRDLRRVPCGRALAGVGRPPSGERYGENWTQ